VVFVMRREVNVLTKIERRKKRQKLRGESVCRIIEMNVEVTDLVTQQLIRDDVSCSHFTLHLCLVPFETI